MTDEFERHKAQREAMARTKRTGRDLFDMIHRYLAVAARRESTTPVEPSTDHAPRQGREETSDQYRYGGRSESKDREEQREYPASGSM